MPTDPHRVKDLFVAALEITDLQARQAYLDRECAGDADLHQRVVALLAAHDQPNPVVNAPLVPPEMTGAYAGTPAPAETPGTIIVGKYKLLQQIGEGGMGSVWMADQLEPVKRRVAVKLIRSERDGSKTILSRFEAERQAIALMDHPNIAKLLDAGTTESNRPFFVMELVKGVPLTEFCDQHRLNITDRLNLFTQICSAAQHAHQKGIIHRDLKPTNILVESHDNKPVPKVIDFGLAKALSGQPLTEHTLFTGFGTVAGTPLYMAPEQANFNAIDIDTRADIYALGVILYEMLTGSTPIERDQLKKAVLDEILRVIRESEPPTPSKRLSSTDSKPSVAANRQMEPAKLGLRPRRVGLDRDESVVEGTRPAIRDGERLCKGHRAIFESRAGGRGAAECAVQTAEIRATESSAGGRRTPCTAHARGWDHWHDCGVVSGTPGEIA